MKNNGKLMTTKSQLASQSRCAIWVTCRQVF